MSLTLVKETEFTVDDIAKFILKYPKFHTALYWQANFINYIQRLFDHDFIAVYHDQNIQGLCCWFFVKPDDEINKIRWTLPQNITDGDILHIGICILQPPCQIWRLRTLFNILYPIEEVSWFTKKPYRRKVNGNKMLCLGCA